MTAKSSNKKLYFPSIIHPPSPKTPTTHPSSETRPSFVGLSSKKAPAFFVYNGRMAKYLLARFDRNSHLYLLDYLLGFIFFQEYYFIFNFSTDLILFFGSAKSEKKQASSFAILGRALACSNCKCTWLCGVALFLLFKYFYHFFS